MASSQRIVRWTGPLPDVLAVGAGLHQAAALHMDGTLWQLAPVPRRLGQLDLPDGVTRAAISADGRLVVVATEHKSEHGTSCGVYVRTAERWQAASEPDFLCAITDVRCAPDGSSFGYGARTSQPWSDYGSYGDRMAGVVICDARGRATWESWDTRRHDEEPTPRLLAWGRGEDPVIFVASDQELTQIAWTRARLVRGAWWDRGPAGAEPREEDLSTLYFPATWATVSPDGRRVGLVSAEGRAVLAEKGRDEMLGTVLEEVVALDLSEPGQVELLRPDGRWERFER